MKQKLFNLLPPATIVAVIAFWAYGPKILIDNPWTFVAMPPLISFFVLGLEWVNERHEGWRLDRREFFTDLFYTVLNATVISWFVTALAENPLLAAKQSLGITTEWAMRLPFLAQVALVVFLVDFGGYWLHRLMHNWTPFWLVHAPHHHITQLNAMKGLVGNPIEIFLISLSVVALFDLPTTSKFAAFSVLAVLGAFIHGNVRADPPKWYSFFFTTIQNHSLHHSVPYEDTRYNYAGTLVVLDRIFGTYRAGEASVVGQGDRKRLSIWEQTIFPFEPLIAKMKKREKTVSADIS